MALLRSRNRRTAAADHVLDESFRILRSNVKIALQGLAQPTVVVTSALQGEGKTSVSALLGRSLANAGSRVVIVDLDLRRPKLGSWFKLDGLPGSVDVLQRSASLREALHRVDVGEGTPLYVMPAGRAVDDSAELLSAERTEAMLRALAERADVVIIDTPPVLPVADTLVVGRLAAGALLVVDIDQTPVAAVERAKDALTRAQTRLLGVVINRVDPENIGYDLGYYAKE